MVWAGGPRREVTSVSLVWRATWHEKRVGAAVRDTEANGLQELPNSKYEEKHVWRKLGSHQRMVTQALAMHCATKDQT